MRHRARYDGLAAVELPMTLADLHRSLQPETQVELTILVDSTEGYDFEGVVVGAGFDLDELATEQRGDEVGCTVQATRARTLPDTVGAGMRLLVCGLNPSVRAADAGVGFVTPGNRYWPAALAAGIVSRDRDPRHALVAHRVGMTDLVKRATPRADALSRHEYESGLQRLDRLCAWLRPAAVCMVGLAGWRAAVDRKAVAGWQDERLGGCPVYVMPSTSGLNAATSLDDLADHLRRASART